MAAQNKQEKNPASRRTTIKTLKTTLLFLLVGLLCLGAFATSYLFSLDLSQKLDPQKIYGVAQSTLVYDNDGAVVANIHGLEDRVWVPLSDIPAHVQQAIISAEDVRFYSHNGVDIKRIFGALWQDIKSGSLDQGASTLTQQLIKNSMLTREKTWSRKIEEAFLSIELERRYTKDEILEMYLNYNYFGAGAYGIEAAAQTYFGIPASELTLDQGALLAGILKSSANYAPHLNPEKSVERRNLVLSLMEKYGYITADQCAQAQAVPLMLHMKEDNAQYGWYVDASLEEAASLLHISYDDLQKGGYRIYTAMDQRMQSTAEALFADAENFPQNASDGTVPQAALSVVDASTGHVCALIGGREYEVQRGLNRATQVKRQPGSVTKPLLVYAPALEEGSFTAASILKDEPTDFDGYQPKNFGDTYNGLVTLRTAVAKSLNVPAVSVLNSIGLETSVSFANSIGLTCNQEELGLSMALGGLSDGFSPLQISSAYAVLANGGTYHAPKMVTRIENNAGEVLYQSDGQGTQVLGEDTTFILCDILQSVVEEGTGKKLFVENVPLAGKTGTNDYEGKGNRDIWSAAFNPDFAATVWMGYDTTDEQHCLPSSATGGSYPAKIIQALFAKYYEDQEGPWFAAPPTVEKVSLDQAALLSGETKLAAENTKDVLEEYLSVEQVAALAQTDYGAAVLEFTANCNEQGQPVLSFSPSSAVAQYQVIRVLDGQETCLDTLSYQQSLSYTDTTAPMEQNLQYYIQPINAEGEKTGTASQRIMIRPMKPVP